MQVERLEDIRLSPTERMVLDQIYSRIISNQEKKVDLPPNYQLIIDRVWSGPDGDN
jgi:hypothetical protein